MLSYQLNNCQKTIVCTCQEIMCLSSSVPPEKLVFYISEEKLSSKNIHILKLCIIIIIIIITKHCKYTDTFILEWILEKLCFLLIVPKLMFQQEVLKQQIRLLFLH
jgi:hypothetical protein